MSLCVEVIVKSSAYDIMFKLAHVGGVFLSGVVKSGAIIVFSKFIFRCILQFSCIFHYTPLFHLTRWFNQVFFVFLLHSSQLNDLFNPYIVYRGALLE